MNGETGEDACPTHMVGRASRPTPERHDLRKKIFLLFLIILIIPACTAHIKKSERAKGVYHRVQSGESLWRIAQAYNTDIQDLAEINNITNPGLIKADSVIFIPGADQAVDVSHPVKKPKVSVKHKLSSSKKRAPAKRDVKGKTVYRAKRKTRQGGKLRFDRKRFIWPVKGKVVSKFGIQPSGMKHNGINIAAKEGAPVVAAANGTVIHSAPLRYYGDTIIIKHKDRYATVYSYLKGRKVKAGDRVKKGERIALLGKPENSNKPYVHFEIRCRNKPRNPVFFLP